jgi:hypothetical protein
MWRMSYQDYRGWRTTDFKQPYPPVQFEDYPDREGAERAKARAAAEGYTACIAPTPTGRLKIKRPTMIADPSGLDFRANWKLAR